MIARPSRPSVRLTALLNPTMKKYVCSVCGYVYDPEKGDPADGIEAGTPFESLPDDWVCPVCGASKDQFDPA